jgi:hypothetical protein
MHREQGQRKTAGIAARRFASIDYGLIVIEKPGVLS